MANGQGDDANSAGRSSASSTMAVITRCLSIASGPGGLLGRGQRRQALEQRAHRIAVEALARKAGVQRADAQREIVRATAKAAAATGEVKRRRSRAKGSRSPSMARSGAGSFFINWAFALFGKRPSPSAPDAAAPARTIIEAVQAREREERAGRGGGA